MSFPWIVSEKRHLVIPQKRKDMCCLQPSSAGCHAWRSGWACGSQGRSGWAGSRCPSWSTGPSHPGRRCRSGRHTPVAQTLSTHNRRFITSPRGHHHHVARLGKGIKRGSFYDLTFSVSKIFRVQLYSAVCGAQTILYLLSSIYEYTHVRKKERTNYVHIGHTVHVVSLPQVEGQLSDGRKEKKLSASHPVEPVCFLNCHSQEVLFK